MCICVCICTRCNWSLKHIAVVTTNCSRAAESQQQERSYSASKSSACSANRNYWPSTNVMSFSGFLYIELVIWFGRSTQVLGPSGEQNMCVWFQRKELGKQLLHLTGPRSGKCKPPNAHIAEVWAEDERAFPIAIPKNCYNRDFLLCLD